MKKWRNGLQLYWVNTSGNEIIRQIISYAGPQVKQDLESLIRGDSIEKVIREGECV